jgi:hypothetical protein
LSAAPLAVGAARPSERQPEPSPVPTGDICTTAIIGGMGNAGTVHAAEGLILYRADTVEADRAATSELV